MAETNSLLAIIVVTWITLLSVSNAVRITKFRVPSAYTLEKNASVDPLVLECEYEVENREKGFVLKWFFNNQSIYQWIPTVKGYAVGFMKSKFDKGQITAQQAHPGVITINNPDWNMTGDYTCFVQTFKSTDKRNAKLNMIVPESDFTLEAKLDTRSDLEIVCMVKNVYPKPVLSLIFQSEVLNSIFTKSGQNTRGLYDAIAKTKIPTYKLTSPSPITCAFVLSETNYTKRRETIYYGRASDLKRSWTTFAVIAAIVAISIKQIVSIAVF